MARSRTPSEERRRRQLINERRLAKAQGARVCPPQCPSVAGYLKHLRKGEPSCVASRREWRKYYQTYRKEKGKNND